MIKILSTSQPNFATYFSYPTKQGPECFYSVPLYNEKQEGRFEFQKRQLFTKPNDEEISSIDPRTDFNNQQNPPPQGK